MGQRPDGRVSDPSELGGRYRSIAFSLLVVTAAFTSAATGATALDTSADSEGIPQQTVNQTESGVTELSSCTVINESGRYELTADVEGRGDSCVQIAASDVVLDGNGHTVSTQSANSTESGVGILVFNGSGDGRVRAGPPLANVTVRDLDVSNWTRGVQVGQTLDTGPTVSLRNVTATNNSDGILLYGADGSQLFDVEASQNEGDGIVLWETAESNASGIIVAENGGTGLSLADSVTNSAFVDVTATGNDGVGVEFSTGATDNRLTDAAIADNGMAGIRFADSARTVVENSTVTGTDGPGILSDPASDDRIVDVTVAGNEIAYRDTSAGARYGVVAHRFRLGTGVVASFDASVSAFDGAADVPEPPENGSIAGPAANVTVSAIDDAGPPATLTFPYDDEAVGSESALAVLRYADGEWHQMPETSVDTGNQTVSTTVRQSGVVVPVVLDSSSPLVRTESTTRRCTASPLALRESPAKGLI